MLAGWARRFADPPALAYTRRRLDTAQIPAASRATPTPARPPTAIPVRTNGGREGGGVSLVLVTT